MNDVDFCNSIFSLAREDTTNIRFIKYLSAKKDKNFFIPIMFRIIDESKTIGDVMNTMHALESKEENPMLTYLRDIPSKKPFPYFWKGQHISVQFASRIEAPDLYEGTAYIIVKKYQMFLDSYFMSVSASIRICSTEGFLNITCLCKPMAITDRASSFIMLIAS
jgi:hypothetical protein